VIVILVILAKAGTQARNPGALQHRQTTNRHSSEAGTHLVLALDAQADLSPPGPPVLISLC